MTPHLKFCALLFSATALVSPALAQSGATNAAPANATVDAQMNNSVDGEADANGGYSQPAGTIASNAGSSSSVDTGGSTGGGSTGGGTDVADGGSTDDGSTGGNGMTDGGTDVADGGATGGSTGGTATPATPATPGTDVAEAPTATQEDRPVATPPTGVAGGSNTVLECPLGAEVCLGSEAVASATAPQSGILGEDRVITEGETANADPAECSLDMEYCSEGKIMK